MIDILPNNAQLEAYDQSKRDRLQSAKCLLAVFDRLGIPKTMLDIGCGPGHLVKIADALGVYAIGADLHCTEMSIGDSGSKLVSVDFARDNYHPHPVETVLCLEVAEHLPERSANDLCDLLADAAERWLVFSAATPGQGGAGHLNEQPKEYWLEKLKARGLVLYSMTLVLKRDFKVVSPGAWWYGKNCQVFCRQENK